jgi:trimethyllysine dioxygenase
VDQEDRKLPLPPFFQFADCFQYIHGFSFISGVPPTPEATEKLLNRIAFIRNTHYGGFWEVIPDLSSKDLAYDNIPLRAHTDTTYFSDPCGLQLFHMLSHTGGTGGESLLVDGFRAASILRKEHPEAYKILSKVRVPAHASGNTDVSIRPYASMPTFTHHPVNGELLQLRWNPDDRGTMDRWANEDETEEWYRAVRLWEAILRDVKSEYVFQLKPGMPVIFDNWRVLHGRRGFTGVRRFCGGYINRDDFYSRYLLTNCGRERVIEAI